MNLKWKKWSEIIFRVGKMCLKLENIWIESDLWLLSIIRYDFYKLLRKDIKMLYNVNSYYYRQFMVVR